MYQEGYFTGVTDIWAADMTTEDTPTTPAAYGVPYVVAKTIGITVTPTYKEGKVYASNTPTRNEKRIALYTVSLNADKLPFAMYNKLMGRSVDKNGVQIIKSGQVAPNVAIAFALTLDDGTKELWWLYKGTFSEPTVTGATENDGSTYQHPTIEGIFVRRADEALAAVVDTASKTITPTVESNWFAKVYEESN